MKKIGNYQVIEELGEGGMGIVYKAKQPGLERIVALKVLLPNLSRKEKFVERFMREARNAGKLDHPNIVTIYEVGKDDDTYYFSMQYVEGDDLGEILEKNRLTLKQAVSIICQVAEGLHYSHTLKGGGIVHRDIKPANIIIDESGKAVITDFGIARAAWEEKLTTTGMSLGTVEYMSPEQLKGDVELDGRSDIYSLGATLYRMVTGTSPFPGKTTMEVMMKKIQGELPQPVEINSSVPQWISEVIMKAMAEDRNKRYKSAIDFAKDLQKEVGVEDLVVPMASKISPTEKHKEAVSREARTVKKEYAPKTVKEASPRPSAKGGKKIGLIIGFFSLIFFGLVITALLLINTFVPLSAPRSDSDVVVDEPIPEPEAISPKQPESSTVETTIIEPTTVEPTKTTDKWGISPPVWVVCSAAVKTKYDAEVMSRKLERLGYPSGVLWIPDYESLSGAEYYLVFIGEFDTEDECREVLYRFKKINPSAYGIYVSHESGRRTIK